MEFTIKITKKDVIIAILSVLLVVVSVCKVSWKDSEPQTTSNILEYGMADEDIKYTIIYDQVNNISKVSAELFGESDTINIDGVNFVRIEPVCTVKQLIRNANRDSIKTIRS